MTEWQLRLSSYDRKVHAFAPEQRDGVWEAACTHSAPSNFLAECPEEFPTCVPCLITFGGAVAARQADQRATIVEGVQKELAAFDGDKHLR